MIRKSIYSIFLLAIIYAGFVYLVASGYLGQYEGPGDVTKLSTPSSIVSDRATIQNKVKNKSIIELNVLFIISLITISYQSFF